MADWRIPASSALNLNPTVPFTFAILRRGVSLHAAGTAAAHGTQAAFASWLSCLPNTAPLNYRALLRPRPTQASFLNATSTCYNYMGGRISSFDSGKNISSCHHSPTHREQEVGVQSLLLLRMHSQSTSSTSFRTTVNLPFQLHTSAFCPSQWAILLWFRRGFYFQRAKLFKARFYLHLLAFARLFMPVWALSFGGFSFVSSRKSCTNIFMAFCSCPEPCTLEILLLFFSQPLAGYVKKWSSLFHNLKLIPFLCTRNIPADIRTRLPFFLGLLWTKQKSIPQICDICGSHYQCISLDLKKILDHSSQGILRHKLGMIGHLSPDQGETWWQELCLPRCLQCLILHPVLHYTLFLCSFRLQHSGFLFTPVTGGVHWCPLAHYLYPMGEGCQTASLSGLRRCCTPLNKLCAQSAGQGTEKQFRNLKEAKQGNVDVELKSLLPSPTEQYFPCQAASHLWTAS